MSTKEVWQGLCPQGGYKIMGEKDLKHMKHKSTVFGFWCSHMVCVLTPGPLLPTCPGCPATHLTREIVCMLQICIPPCVILTQTLQTVGLCSQRGSMWWFVVWRCSICIWCMYMKPHTDLWKMGETYLKWPSFSLPIKKIYILRSSDLTHEIQLPTHHLRPGPCLWL